LTHSKGYSFPERKIERSKRKIVRKEEVEGK
jgi:hypothetical protein